MVIKKLSAPKTFETETKLADPLKNPEILSFLKQNGLDPGYIARLASFYAGVKTETKPLVQPELTAAQAILASQIAFALAALAKTGGSLELNKFTGEPIMKLSGKGLEALGDGIKLSSGFTVTLHFNPYKFAKVFDSSQVQPPTLFKSMPNVAQQQARFDMQLALPGPVKPLVKTPDIGITFTIKWL